MTQARFAADRLTRTEAQILRLRFVVNIETAPRARLGISSNPSQLAGAVEQGGSR